MFVIIITLKLLIPCSILPHLFLTWLCFQLTTLKFPSYLATEPKSKLYLCLVFFLPSYHRERELPPPITKGESFYQFSRNSFFFSPETILRNLIILYSSLFLSQQYVNMLMFYPSSKRKILPELIFLSLPSSLPCPSHSKCSKVCSTLLVSTSSPPTTHHILISTLSHFHKKYFYQAH